MNDPSVVEGYARIGQEQAVSTPEEFTRLIADETAKWSAVRGEDDIARAVEAAGDTPVNINMGFFIRQRPTSPLLPLKRLKELGVARVSSPRMLTSAAISGMRKALEVMQQCMITGELADRPDLTASMEEITELFDYEKIAALENAFSLEEGPGAQVPGQGTQLRVRTGTRQ